MSWLTGSDEKKAARRRAQQAAAAKKKKDTKAAAAKVKKQQDSAKKAAAAQAKAMQQQASQYRADAQKMQANFNKQLTMVQEGFMDQMAALRRSDKTERMPTEMDPEVRRRQMMFARRTERRQGAGATILAG